MILQKVQDEFQTYQFIFCCCTVQKFLCGGRLVFGPDAASLLLTSVLIGCPAIAFCIKMVLLIGEVEPSFGYPVLIVGVIITLMVGPCNRFPPEVDNVQQQNRTSVSLTLSFG